MNSKTLCGAGFFRAVKYTSHIRGKYCQGLGHGTTLLLDPGLVLVKIRDRRRTNKQ
ncbi:MAG: hypothetical protein O4807_04485 [Trichodesmium sp. St19_bin2]|nr:hypothetical protein [Trichodesmium sp. St19_bin2]